jgi:dTDP-glucose 4,6-dehydratase
MHATFRDRENPGACGDIAETDKPFSRRCYMRKLLVTGGAGFIGSNFVHHWLRGHPGDRVVVLDALTYAGNPSNLAALDNRASFRFVQGNVCDGARLETLLRAEHIDTIVHFAAESHVDRSIAGPAAFIETNVVGTHTLLEAARKVWSQERVVEQHRFHHISTDEVYGTLGPDDPPFCETTAYAPNSPYSASKAASDHLVRAYHHTYGLAVTTSNCSNNYGPFHFPEKLIPLTIVNILQGRPLPVYGDGGNVRDWLHVADHCQAIELIIEHGRPGEVYNVGGDSEFTNIDLVRTLCRIADSLFHERPDFQETYPRSPAGRRGAASLIEFVRDRPGHDRRYAIDYRKIERELGYRPQIPLEHCLRQTFAWYMQQEAWWRAILDDTYQDNTRVRAAHGVKE